MGGKKIKILIIIILIIFLEENSLHENTNIFSLQKKYRNKEIIGKLEIPYLFDILLVKTNNNYFYLNHNLYKLRDEEGTPCIDFRVNITSNQINIYGHNSNIYDLPFKHLTKYLDKDYFDKNNIIYLNIYNELRIYCIFFIKEVTNDIEHLIMTSNQLEHINMLLENTIHKKDIFYDNNSEILLLQTCTLKDNNSFYIIGAIRI